MRVKLYPNKNENKNVFIATIALELKLDFYRLTTHININKWFDNIFLLNFRIALSVCSHLLRYRVYIVVENIDFSSKVYDYIINIVLYVYSCNILLLPRMVVLDMVPIW